MKIGIVSTFIVSVICFVFSYLVLIRDETFLTLIFLGIGVVLAGCGVYFTAMYRKETTGSETK
jgi:drug/metabolite transporter (DMT)-like permease